MSWADIGKLKKDEYERWYSFGDRVRFWGYVLGGALAAALIVFGFS